jgi:hypothetical protein
MATIGPSAQVLFPQLANIPGMPSQSAAPAPVATTNAAPALPLPAPMPVASPSGLVSTEALKALAPEKLVGFDRVSLGVEASGRANSQSVSLDAEYRKGKRFIELEITHSPNIAALIGFGGPATSEYDRETAEGYSRRRREGAAIVAEEWNKASGSGSYARLTDDEFYVKASGGGVAPEDLKEAVESFTPQRLAQLERAP